MDFTTLWMAWGTVSRTTVCLSAFCHRILWKKSTHPIASRIILDSRPLESWEINPCCSYNSQSYIFVRTVPAATDELSAQILSAGPRYQYLNLAVHGCPLSKYCLRLCWRPQPAPLPFGSALKGESNEWWDSQAWWITPFQSTVKGQPSFHHPGGSEWGLL